MPNLTENDKGSTDRGSTVEPPPHPNKLDTQNIIKIILSFLDIRNATNVTNGTIWKLNIWPLKSTIF